MLRAGTFRHAITIETPVETIGSAGKVSTAWAALMSLRAELASNEITEGTADNGQREATTLTFRTHFRPGITTAHRVTYAGQPYNITKLVEVERRQGLEITCERIAS